MKRPEIRPYMPQTTDDRITAARRALETGQPKVALDYMRKVSSDLEAARRDRLTPEQRQWEDIRDAYIEVTRKLRVAFAPVFEQIKENVAQINEALRPVMEHYERSFPNA